MRNIIFDFGNVLVQWHPEVVYDKYFGDAARTWWFMRHVCDLEWRGRIDAGEDQRSCIGELQAKHPEYSEAIELYMSRWEEMLTGEMPGMRDLLAELKALPDVQVFGLTNWSMETFPIARRRFEILQMIDRYVVSANERMVKPDLRLFQVLMNRYGLRAEDCVFVDDNAANVEAARRLGMTGIVFDGADDLRRRLGMMRTLTPEEIEQLERQGNHCDNWVRVKVADGINLAAIHHNIFDKDIELGEVDEVSFSHLKNSSVGDGSTVRQVRMMDNYAVGCRCHLSNVGEMSFSPEPVEIAVMNENCGRSIVPFKGMTIGDAYLWARFRDRRKVMRRLEQMTTERRGHVGDGSEIRNATAIIDGIVGAGCKIEHGVIAERFLLGENVKLEAGLRLNDSVVGDNSTLARGEVGNSLIFPAHEQHHNNSFLIAALVQGQSNVAAGCTLGSNHNGRTADGELSAGRGFWPGLCTSVKHSCRFASYTLMAKGDYPSELNITLPFSLVNNNVAKNRLEVMPAYWWLYNMYALNRNIRKFADRDRRNLKRQHVEFSPFAPDTAEEMLVGRGLLHMWTTKAYQDGEKTEVIAYGMEKGHRKTVILKPGDGYRAYEEMLIYYAMQVLTAHFGDAMPPETLGEGKRTQRWVNIGGQLIQGHDMDVLLDDIESGALASWDDIHRRLDELWTRYDADKTRHAYQVLCELSQKNALDKAEWSHYQQRHTQICQLVKDRIVASRQKDADNEFRQMTYWNLDEMNAVLN